MSYNMCLNTQLHLTLLQQGRYWHQLTVCSCCCWSWNVSWAIVLSRVLSSALSSCTSLISSSNWKNTIRHKHRVNNMIGKWGKQHFVKVQNLWLAIAEDAAKSEPSRKWRNIFSVTGFLLYNRRYCDNHIVTIDAAVIVYCLVIASQCLSQITPASLFFQWSPIGPVHFLRVVTKMKFLM